MKLTILEGDKLMKLNQAMHERVKN